MSVFDGDAFLQAAIDSVLGQTFADFELIIVDDGSGDRTARILAAAAAQDPRIVVLTNPSNHGLTPSLNRGITAARGALIARQDADDVSVPERLSRQVAFLKAHPEVGLLGTAYHEIDAAGRPMVTRYPPETDTGIRAKMLFHNALCHTAVMVRRTALDREPQGYDESLPYSQDVDLWTRLLRHTTSANLQTPLVSLRKHPRTISVLHARQQQRIATRIALRQIHKLAPELALSEPQVQSLRDWYGGISSQVPAAQLHLCRYYFDLLDALARRSYADTAVLAQCRRFHIQALLGRVTPAQLLGLITSRVVWRMFRADPLTTTQIGGVRLLRQAQSALIGKGGGP
jgi:glycosyltransferase involved in cell wall biosynthesis